MIKNVIQGENDLYTTHPEYVKYFVNEEDSKRTSYGSNKKFLMKCPECGYEKLQTVNRLISQGFACQCCSDGISYGEKFILNLLIKLNIQFITQLNKKHFEWCDKYRYDFYVPKFNMIIEVNGQQHYKKSFETCGGKTLKEEQENDEIKKEIALKYVDKYVVINALKSELNQIKNSILKELDFIDFSNIDWNEIDLKSRKSILIKVCDYYKNGMSVNEIMDITKLSRSTVIRYLNRGTDINLCCYDGKKETSIKEPTKIIVIDKNGKEYIFESIRQCIAQSENIFGVRFTRQTNRVIDKDVYYKGYKFKSLK